MRRILDKVGLRYDAKSRYAFSAPAPLPKSAIYEFESSLFSFSFAQALVQRIVVSAGKSHIGADAVSLLEKKNRAYGGKTEQIMEVCLPRTAGLAFQEAEI